MRRIRWQQYQKPKKVPMSSAPKVSLSDGGASRDDGTEVFPLNSLTIVHKAGWREREDAATHGVHIASTASAASRCRRPVNAFRINNSGVKMLLIGATHRSMCETSITWRN